MQKGEAKNRLAERVERASESRRVDSQNPRLNLFMVSCVNGTTPDSGAKDTLIKSKQLKWYEEIPKSLQST